MENIRHLVDVSCLNFFYEQMQSAENHDGDHGDGETSSQAYDAQDLEIPPDAPNTIPTAEEQTQDTAGSMSPVGNESQASPPSSPASDEGTPSPDSSLVNSEVAVHTAAVNASLAKYDVLHPDAKGQDGDWLRCTNCGQEQEVPYLFEYYSAAWHVLNFP